MRSGARRRFAAHSRPAAFLKLLPAATRTRIMAPDFGCATHRHRFYDGRQRSCRAPTQRQRLRRLTRPRQFVALRQTQCRAIFPPHLREFGGLSRPLAPRLEPEFDRHVRPIRRLGRPHHGRTTFFEIVGDRVGLRWREVRKKSGNLISSQFDRQECFIHPFPGSTPTPRAHAIRLRAVSSAHRPGPARLVVSSCGSKKWSQRILAEPLPARHDSEKSCASFSPPP